MARGTVAEGATPLPAMPNQRRAKGTLAAIRWATVAVYEPQLSATARAPKIA
jgi:hypothetical protein